MISRPPPPKRDSKVQAEMEGECHVSATFEQTPFRTESPPAPLHSFDDTLESVEFGVAESVWEEVEREFVSNLRDLYFELRPRDIKRADIDVVWVDQDPLFDSPSDAIKLLYEAICCEIGSLRARCSKFEERGTIMESDGTVRKRMKQAGELSTKVSYLCAVNRIILSVWHEKNEEGSIWQG